MKKRQTNPILQFFNFMVAHEGSEKLKILKSKNKGHPYINIHIDCKQKCNLSLIIY